MYLKEAVCFRIYLSGLNRTFDRFVHNIYMFLHVHLINNNSSVFEK